MEERQNEVFTETKKHHQKALSRNVNGSRKRLLTSETIQRNKMDKVKG